MPCYTTFSDNSTFSSASPSSSTSATHTGTPPKSPKKRCSGDVDDQPEDGSAPSPSSPLKKRKTTGDLPPTVTSSPSRARSPRPRSSARSPRRSGVRSPSTSAPVSPRYSDGSPAPSSSSVGSMSPFRHLHLSTPPDSPTGSMSPFHRLRISTPVSPVRPMSPLLRLAPTSTPSAIPEDTLSEDDGDDFKPPILRPVWVWCSSTPTSTATPPSPATAASPPAGSSTAPLFGEDDSESDTDDSDGLVNQEGHGGPQRVPSFSPTSSPSPSSSSSANSHSLPASSEPRANLIARLEALQDHNEHLEADIRALAERNAILERQMECIRQECKEPFLVPSLLTAFLKVTELVDGVWWH